MNTTAILLKALPALVVAFSLVTIGTSQSVQALPAEADKAITSTNQAADSNNDIGRVKDQVSADQPTQTLMTQPKKAEDLFGLGGSAPTERMNEVSDTIPSASSKAPQSVKPADAIADPAGAIQRFFQQQPSDAKPMQPLEFFKVPGMNSGIKLDVWKF